MKVVALAMLIGCSDPSGGSTDGPQVFATLCAACHGPEGKPNEAMVARLAVRDLTDPAWRATATPALVEHQIRTGSANKLMPSFQNAITDAQIKSVAAFVASPSFLKR